MSQVATLSQCCRPAGGLRVVMPCILYGGEKRLSAFMSAQQLGAIPARAGSNELPSLALCLAAGCRPDAGAPWTSGVCGVTTSRRRRCRARGRAIHLAADLPEVDVEDCTVLSGFDRWVRPGAFTVAPRAWSLAATGSRQLAGETARWRDGERNMRSMPAGWTATAEWACQRRPRDGAGRAARAR